MLEQRAQTRYIQPSQRERPNDDTRSQLSQDRGDLEVSLADFPRQLRCEEYYSQLKDKPSDRFCAVLHFRPLSGKNTSLHRIAALSEDYST